MSHCMANCPLLCVVIMAGHDIVQFVVFHSGFFLVQTVVPKFPHLGHDLYSDYCI